MSYCTRLFFSLERKQTVNFVVLQPTTGYMTLGKANDLAVPSLAYKNRKRARG